MRRPCMSVRATMTVSMRPSRTICRNSSSCLGTAWPAPRLPAPCSSLIVPPMPCRGGGSRGCGPVAGIVARVAHDGQTNSAFGLWPRTHQTAPNLLCRHLGAAQLCRSVADFGSSPRLVRLRARARPKSRARTEVGNTPMNDRDVEAQPGDIKQTELEGEPLERPAESNRIATPHKADVARSDQARLARPGSQAHRVGEPPYPRVRLTAAHPRSRIRREKQAKGPAFSLAGLRASVAALGRSLGGGFGSHRPQVSGQAFRPANMRRLVFRRPTLKGIFAFAVTAPTVAVVMALLFTLPTNPAAPSASGSIYGITWQAAVKAPTSKIDFGPYFTTYGPDMLMLGTVLTTNGSTTTTATTVWASTDGATWTERSGSGAFDVGD